MIKITHKRVTNGRNVWYVDATVLPGKVMLNRIYGDITDVLGITSALKAMVAGSKRYQRVYG